MSGFPRIAIAAVLVAGLGGSIAQAQSRQGHAAPADYYAVSEGRSIAVDRPMAHGAPVAPSESRTVMGLRVPR